MMRFKQSPYGARKSVKYIKHSWTLLITFRWEISVFGYNWDSTHPMTGETMHTQCTPTWDLPSLLKIFIQGSPIVSLQTEYRLAFSRRLFTVLIDAECIKKEEAERRMKKWRQIHFPMRQRTKKTKRTAGTLPDCSQHYIPALANLPCRGSAQ